MRAEERRGRDDLVLRMFLGGASYRQIARRVGLRSPQSVSNIVRRELRSGAGPGTPVTEVGRAVFVERLEALLAAVWPGAMAGDHQAGEECLQLLSQLARFYGLT
ncbi:MAG: hypothetical protein JWO98_3502 [Frankiales bacterium]|nr:hypothetical protein [Frankiales bacterium]